MQNKNVFWKTEPLSYLHRYMIYWFLKLHFEISVRLLQNTGKNRDIKIFIKYHQIILLRCSWQMKSKGLLIEIYFRKNKADQRSMKWRAFWGPVEIEVSILCLLLKILVLWFVQKMGERNEFKKQLLHGLAWVLWRLCLSL